MRNFLIIGHRGWGPTSTLKDDEFSPDTLPENSLAALGYALSVGADGVEFDVHKTKDNKVVVIHDDDLNKKVYRSGHIGKDLGLVQDHNLSDLAQYDIGNGHKIPSLAETLDLLSEENKRRQKQDRPNVIINIELKGRDVVQPTYETILPYLKKKKLCERDFVFNSFVWDRLEQMKALEPDFKVVPAIRTIDLFGIHNVQMPGYTVPHGVTYQQEGLKAIQDFHEKVGCHAFDCIIFDLRPEFIHYCDQNRIGLFTSTSKESIQAHTIRQQLAMMIDASAHLPTVCFRADNASDTRNLLSAIEDEKSAVTQLRQIVIQPAAPLKNFNR